MKIKIYYDENVLLAVSENFKFFTKLINGKFPNYERVIPSDTAYKILISRDKMVSGVRAINAMCEEMKVTIKKDGMIFESINEDNSEAKTEIEAAIEINSEIVFGVKNRFLLDFLSSPVCESKIYALIPSGGKFELKGARADEFKVLASGGYRGRNVGMDENAVYCGNLAMIGLDPSRARAIGNGYFTDGEISYFCSDVGERNYELGELTEAVQTAAYALLGADKPQSYIYKTRRVSSV